MTAAKPTSEEAVVKALATRSELTSAEIATATGLGRSTVGKTLAAPRAGQDRSPEPRWARRRTPAARPLVSRVERRASPPGSSSGRLRPGQLDGLVLDFINAHGKDGPVGATAVAKALGRSAGAVGNCLTRLAVAGQVRQVSEKPRRYSSATPASSKRGRRRGQREEES